MSIQVKKLWHTYSSGLPFETIALKDISLTIDDGEFVAIIGQTGSGKSTLVQHFNGLLMPTDGQVLIDGIDIKQKRSHLKEVRQRVGLVFQYPEHQLFEETVFDDVAFGPKNMGLPQAEIKERVNEALRAVGISLDLHQRSPFELSGGQMRRIAIAGVLAMHPKVLILDEPTAGLDPRGREDILTLVTKLHQQREIAVILVSHSMEDVAKVANRLIVMHQGEIFIDGSPRQVFKDANRLQSIGLDVPAVAELMQKLRAKGFQLPEVVLTVEEAQQAVLAALELGVQRA